jgi:magnesium-transporting ATPase (P-type)
MTKGGEQILRRLEGLTGIAWQARPNAGLRSVICTDKTGTLSENRMGLDRLDDLIMESLEDCLPWPRSKRKLNWNALMPSYAVAVPIEAGHCDGRVFSLFV